MKISSETGLSALAVVGVMVILSIMGLSLASIVTTSHAVKTDELTYDRAFYVQQAGLEYGMRKIYEGLSPVVGEPGISFGGGSFVIDRVDRRVTVTGRFGEAQVAHSVTSPSQADCTEIDVTGAMLSEDGKKIRNIQLRKICLETTVLDKITVSWTSPGSEGLKKVRVESSTLYEEPPVPSGSVTELADYRMTGNNMNNMNEIKFSHDMEDKTFTMSFIMGDGSSENATFTPSD